MFAAEANTINAKEGYNTRPVGETYQVQMSGDGKKCFQMPWWRRWGWTMIELRKQFRHLIICCLEFVIMTFLNIIM